MFWRLLTVVFLVAIGASVWGGIALGNWLVANGPLRAPNMAEFTEPTLMPTLDADGKPFTAQPPQPLINGRLGVPEPIEPIDWDINSPSADQDNPPIALAKTRITMAEAQVATQRSDSGLQGIANLGNLGQGGNQEIQPVDIATPPPPPQQVTGTTSANWQGDLQRELHACSQRGFFERPSCSWDVRNKYCGPNNAWGRVAGCPSKSF